MAFSHTRNALLSMRNWWKKLPNNNMKPMLPADWNACNAAGLLKPRRGTRGGSKNRLTNHIQVLDPGTRPWIINTFARKIGRNRNLENYQTENTASTKTNYNSIGSHGRPHFFPSILLSNTMSLVDLHGST
jgi:hypothetical protein